MPTSGPVLELPVRASAPPWVAPPPGLLVAPPPATPPPGTVVDDGGAGCVVGAVPGPGYPWAAAMAEPPPKVIPTASASPAQRFDFCMSPPSLRPSWRVPPTHTASHDSCQVTFR